MENPKLIKTLIPVFILGFFVSGAAQALAYGVDTHSFLTQETIKFYNQHFTDNKNKIDENRGGLAGYIIEGSRQEDNSPRWLNHFFDPVYNRGLTYDPAIDPINPGGPWQASRDWAQDRLNQNNLIYKVPATIASILTAIEQRKISAISSETDFTWQRAIDFYVNNEPEKAMFALGHILHLLQDASVPDHTRNDPHPFDSPYERYADRFNLSNPDSKLRDRLKNKEPIIFNNLNSYFEELARYSNNNFYSKDTIGIQTGYSLPQPDYFKKEYGFLYSIKEDAVDGAYRLSIRLGTALPGSISDYKYNTVLWNDDPGGDLVMLDYWSRLSTKSVQYGAGIINLFFKEAEKAKAEKVFLEKDKTFLGQTVDSIASFINSMGANAKEAWRVIIGAPRQDLVEEIHLSKDDSAGQPVADQSVAKTKQENQFSLSVNPLQINPGEKVQFQGSKFIPQSPLILYIERPDGRQSEQRIIADTKGEFNVSYAVPSDAPAGIYFGYVKDLNSGITGDRVKFRVLEKSEQQANREQQTNREELAEQEKSMAQKTGESKQKEDIQTQKDQAQKEQRLCGFATSQSPSRRDILINEVAWMGSAGNANHEWIELKNISGRDFDISGWQIFDSAEQIKIQIPAGSQIRAGGFYLLERTSDDSAPYVQANLIYTGALSNTNEGLRLFDSQCNLIDEVLANPSWPAGDAASRRTMERSRDNLSWHTSGFVDGTPKQENSEPSPSFGGGTVALTTPASESQPSEPLKILISEVQITGGTGKTDNDFIEIYNPNDTAVNLKGYRLVKRTKGGTEDSSIKSWTADAFIPANGYYLWVNSNYSDLVSLADVSTSATIAADNGIAIRFGPADTGVIIDSVAWGAAENVFAEAAAFPLNPGTNQSIQRKPRPEPTEGFIDTNNNAEDFELQNCPSPKSRIADCPPQSGETPSSALAVKIIEVIFDPDGSDAGKERVILENPAGFEIDLSHYSLQYLGPNDGFAEIKKKDFGSESKIPPQGFFKIGMNCSAAVPCEDVDMSWSQNLHNQSGTVFLVSHQNKLGGPDDAGIVDVFEYAATSAVPAPDDLTLVYNPDLLEIEFFWDEHPQLTYEIREYDAEGEGEGEVIFRGNGNEFSQKIDEVGRTYKFSLQAFDADNIGSEIIKAEIDIPSFIRDVAFYKASRRASYGTEVNEPVIEFFYENYPFLPRDLSLALAYGEPPSPNYKIMVFYLNSEAPKDIFLDKENPRQERLDQVLQIKYSTCSSGAETYKPSLLLPDTQEKCDILIGGIPNSAIDFNRYLREGDSHLLLPVQKIDGTFNFQEGDYITAAYYGLYRFYPQGYEGPDSSNVFKLLAVDKTKYYFQTGLPRREPPTPPSSVAVSLDENKFELKVVLGPATDPDTLDELLQYQISYDNGATWDNVYGLVSSKVIAPGTSYILKIKTIDDFGVESEILEYPYDAPVAPPPFGLSEMNWRKNAAGEIVLSFNYNNYPFISPAPDNQNHQFDVMVFYLNQLPPTASSAKFGENESGARLQLRHQSCAGQSSDYSSLVLARSPEFVRDSASGELTPPNICFTYSPPIKRAALVPSPEINKPGQISLLITGLVNADKQITELGTSDYFTIGFYNIIDYQGNLVFVGSDPNRYYLEIEQ